MTLIEQLLRDGTSVDDLIKEIKETKIRIEKEKAKEALNREKVSKARSALLSAFAEYFSTLGMEINAETFMKNSESYLKSLEKTIALDKNSNREDLIAALLNL